MWGGIKRRPADIKFSQYIRKLRNYICEVCGTRHDEKSKNCGLSHFWPRSAESVRFDESNVEILCNIPCHQYFESHRTEYEQWKLKQMGKKAYNSLMLRAHTPKKKDDKLVLL